MSHGLLSPGVSGQIDAVCPVNWLDPLNRSLLARYLCVPGWTGGSRWVNIVRAGDKDGLHGTLVGGPKWNSKSDRLGGAGCLDLDGTDDYVDLPPIDLGANHTVSVWIRPNDLTNRQTILSSGNAIVFEIRNSTFVWYALNTFSALPSFDPSVLMIVGRWYNIAATYDGVTARIYLDGVERGSAALSSYDPPSGVYRLGATDAASNLLNGSVDDLSIWNRTLGIHELGRICRDGKQGSPSTLRRLTWSLGGLPETYTGSIATGLSHLTCEVTGTFTAPTYTGSSAASLADLACSVAGTHAAPTYTATASTALSEITAASSGTHTAPIYTATAATLLAELVASASGTHTAPVYSGTGSPSLAEIAASVVGTHTAPVYTGSISSMLPEIVASVSGAHTAPVYTGSSASILAELTATISGTHTVPIYTGTIASALSDLTASASGTHVAPTYTGSSTASLSEMLASAVGSHASPVYSGSISASLSEILAGASGTHTGPVYTGTVAVSLAAILGAVTGTFFAGGISDHILGRLDILPAVGGTVEILPAISGVAELSLPAIGGTVELNPEGPW